VVTVPAAQSDESEGGVEEPIAMTERREWLENRMAAHDTEQAVPLSDRGIREEWACPLAYGTFANDYHFPRSHGRRHKGLDMFSTEGTPIVAIHSGFVVTRDDTDHFNGEYDLGGVTVTIATRPDRTWGIDQELLPEDPDEPTAEWYYAHLQGIADGIDQHTWVEAGQVIGFVGDTGNARGTAPHLHLGHTVDGRSVNPYPSIAVACHSQRPALGLGLVLVNEADSAS
jgi:murein DD-endopeptidase MepM/ murein hydrolase activator NlpD